MSDASREGPSSILDLLLGMGDSSMRKRNYPELRSKLDKLFFANRAAREAFVVGGGEGARSGIPNILSEGGAAGVPRHRRIPERRRQHP
jgi:hypothetical protein